MPTSIGTGLLRLFSPPRDILQCDSHSKTATVKHVAIMH